MLADVKCTLSRIDKSKKAERSVFFMLSVDGEVAPAKYDNAQMDCKRVDKLEPEFGKVQA